MTAVAVAAALYVGLSAPAPDLTPTPENPLISQALQDAHGYFTAGEFDRACALLEELLADQPDNADAHALLTETLMGQGRLEEAYRHAVRCLQLKPGQEELHFLAGVLAGQILRMEDSLAHYQRAAQLRPNSAKYALYLGGALLNVGKLDEAQIQALRAQQINGALPEVYYLLARTYERRQKTDAALGMADKALALLAPGDPKYPAYLIYKGQLLRRNGQPEEALNILRSLDPKQQQSEEAVAEVAQSYLMLSEPRKAAGAWIYLLLQEPQNARAAGEAGLCLLRAGQPGEARKYLGLGERINPDHPSVQALRQAAKSP